jgi:hypothetical protein
MNKRIPLHSYSIVSQNDNGSNTNRTVNSNYYDNKDNNNNKLHYIYSNDKLLQKITNDNTYKPFNNCYSNSNINNQHNNNKNQFESPSSNYYTQRRNEIKQNNPCVHYCQHYHSHVPCCCYYEEDNNNNTMNMFNTGNDNNNNNLNSGLYTYEKYSTAHNVKYKPRKKPNDLIINEQHKTPSNIYTYNNNNNTQQMNNRYMTYESRNEPSNYSQTFINNTNTNTTNYDNEYPYYNQPRTNVCICSNCNNEHCHHHHHCCCCHY